MLLRHPSIHPSIHPSLPPSLPPTPGDLFVHKPNSRLHETEADTVGVLLCARAGYDPTAAVRVFEKMAKVEEKRSGGVKMPGFLSTVRREGGREGGRERRREGGREGGREAGREGGREGRIDERKRTGLSIDTPVTFGVLI